AWFRFTHQVRAANVEVPANVHFVLVQGQNLERHPNGYIAEDHNSARLTGLTLKLALQNLNL
ncbi:hypothetical protein Q5506_24260, partial [Escherichia coli]|nr:hypothetical protein [Escherichia coli]